MNRVGVNVNTASKYLLAYVAGLGNKLAESIVSYREENGLIQSRAELKKIPKMGAKSFEQSVGFLRVPVSKNVLDNSAVHPENYKTVLKMAKSMKVGVEDLIGSHELLSQVNQADFVTESAGKFTITDIIDELKKPGIDPREEAKVLEVDNVIICAGQVPFKELYQPLLDIGKKVHVIGGADFASELDAKRAINQGARIAVKL